MILLVSILHVVVCLLLLFIILLQPGKGMGLSSAAFGGDGQSVFGTKTADVLTKATTVAAVLFMITCISLSSLTAKKSRSLYSNFQNQAPITMEQVQKAVKEAEEKAASQAPAAVTAPVSPAAAEVQAVVDQAAASASQVAAEAPAAPAEAKPAA